MPAQSTKKEQKKKTVRGSRPAKNAMRMRMRQCSSSASDVILSASVHAALAERRPVIALESTIISHGLPYPENLKIAHELESTIVSLGAIPATIAVIDGIPHAGLSSSHLQSLAEHPQQFPKLSLRDLPLAKATKSNGATTVSATLHIALRAGIRVFATGGLGGVHRDAFDISQDLLAISRHPGLVVCAGVKSILHIPHTLEALEALCIPVWVWKSSTFPAFYTANSKCAAPATVNDACTVANALRATWLHSPNPSGAVLAVPVPDGAAADANATETASAQALRELKELRISGKNVTPFLLRRVAEITKGASVRANVALVLNNARVATMVAIELAGMDRIPKQFSSVTDAVAIQKYKPMSPAQVVVVGAVAADVVAVAETPDTQNHGGSRPGRVTRGVGGVACNIARAAVASGASVTLVAPVGDDDAGKAVCEALRTEIGMHATQGIAVVPGERTPAYCAVHDATGELQAAVADMHALTRPGALVQHVKAAVSKEHTRVLAMDANGAPEELFQLARFGKDTGVLVWAEPTSCAKCTRLVKAGALRFVDYISPNADELHVLAQACSKNGAMKQNLDEAAKAVREYAPQVTIVCTRGAKGVTVYTSQNEKKMYSALPVTVQNASGAGDAFAGAMIAYVAKHGTHFCLDHAVRAGLVAAKQACLSHSSSARARL